jgi:Zn-dependent membrane protease YugP
MLFALLFLVLALAILPLPQFFVERVIRRNSRERPNDFPLSGSAVARKMLNAHRLHQVDVVECATEGDHYDPEAKAVRLSPAIFHGHTLAAVTIAAHEVGHAIQDAADYAPLAHRQRMVRVANGLSKVAAVVMLLSPVLVLVTKSPHAAVFKAALGAALFALGACVHMLSLPVENDASFNRALPMLREGGYVQEPDMREARRLLKAAKYTYVATAAMDVLNIMRWFRILRR